jgi:hypothetical protein
VVVNGLANRRHGRLAHVGHWYHESAAINIGRGLRPWSVLYDFAAACDGQSVNLEPALDGGMRLYVTDYGAAGTLAVGVARFGALGNGAAGWASRTSLVSA